MQYRYVCYKDRTLQKLPRARYISLEQSKIPTGIYPKNPPNCLRLRPQWSKTLIRPPSSRCTLQFGDPFSVLIFGCSVLGTPRITQNDPRCPSVRVNKGLPKLNSSQLIVNSMKIWRTLITGSVFSNSKCGDDDAVLSSRSSWNLKSTNEIFRGCCCYNCHACTLYIGPLGNYTNWWEASRFPQNSKGDYGTREKERCFVKSWICNSSSQGDSQTMRSFKSITLENICVPKVFSQKWSEEKHFLLISFLRHSVFHPSLHFSADE